MKFNKKTDERVADNVDYSKPMAGSKCEDCDRTFNHFIPRPPVRPLYYCREHLPENKKDWRSDALRDAWLKNKELMVKIVTDFESLSPYEQYRATRAAHGGKLDKRSKDSTKRI